MNHIITNREAIPIPDSSRFFCTARSSNYDGPGDPIGYGRNEFEAQADFFDQVYADPLTTLELVERVIERRGRVPFTFDGYCAMMEPLAFITELESRSMSTWTDAEGTRYCELTGQAPWEPWSSDYEVSLRRQENL